SRAYGTVKRLKDGDSATDTTPETGWERLREAIRSAKERRAGIEKIERGPLAEISAGIEDLRLEILKIHRAHRDDDASVVRSAAAPAEERMAELKRRYDSESERLKEARSEDARHSVTLETADGRDLEIVLSDIVRVQPTNSISIAGRFLVYLDRV